MPLSHEYNLNDSLSNSQYVQSEFELQLQLQQKNATYTFFQRKKYKLEQLQS
jgi:hypothetical protein